MVENIVAYETAVLDRICAVCIDRKDDGDCGLDPALECSIKQHLPALLEMLQGVTFDNMSEYVDRVRNSVCNICNQGNQNGTCNVREHVDCSLDRYLALVVEAIEEVDRRKPGAAAPRTH